MKNLLVLSIVLVGWFSGKYCVAADPPSPPPASMYAPADELVKLVDDYVGKLREGVKDESVFESGKARLKKEASTLACFALTLGLHDTANPLQKSAPALLAGAQALARAESVAEANAAVGQIDAALKGDATGGGELKWERVASLGQLMKQVTFVNARLKRGARPGPRFDASAGEAAGYATTLAVIGQAVTTDTHEVKNAEDTGKWFEYCAAMRDAGGETAAALRARDAEAAQAGLKKLEQSCNGCHKTFRVETTE